MKHAELFSLPTPSTKAFVDPVVEEAFTAAEHPAAIVEAATARPAKKVAPKVAAAPEPIPKSGATRLGVDVPPSLLRALKFRALEQGRTVRELVIELLMQGLAG